MWFHRTKNALQASVHEEGESLSKKRTLVKNHSNSRYSNVGAIQCDTGNTVALCTALGSGSASQFPNLNLAHAKNNSSVSITIPPLLLILRAPWPKARGLLFLSRRGSLRRCFAKPKIL